MTLVKRAFLHGMMWKHPAETTIFKSWKRSKHVKEINRTLNVFFVVLLVGGIGSTERLTKQLHVYIYMTYMAYMYICTWYIDISISL